MVDADEDLVRIFASNQGKSAVRKFGIVYCLVSTALAPFVSVGWRRTVRPDFERRFLVRTL